MNFLKDIQIINLYAMCLNSVGHFSFFIQEIFLPWFFMYQRQCVKNPNNALGLQSFFTSKVSSLFGFLRHICHILSLQLSCWSLSSFIAEICCKICNLKDKVEEADLTWTHAPIGHSAVIHNKELRVTEMSLRRRLKNWASWYRHSGWPLGMRHAQHVMAPTVQTWIAVLDNTKI